MVSRRLTRYAQTLLPIALITLATIAVAGCIIVEGEAVALVDDRTITATELLEETMQAHGADLLLEMIDTQIILQEARRHDIGLGEEAVETELERAAGQVGGMNDLERRLAGSGRSMEDFRTQCQASVALDMLARPLIPVDENTLKKYYEQHKDDFSHQAQVHARWMLFDDKQSAEAIASVLKEPDASFAGLAKAFSSDSVTAPKGGDMGFIGRDDYADEVTDVAFSLEPGQTSDVFEVPDGWAIVQVVEKRPAGSPPFEEVADQLKARIWAEKMPAARQEWLKRARTEADLQINDADLARQVEALIGIGHPYNPTQLLQVPQPGPRASTPLR